jgi:sulfide:quinone oxidoreductase
MMVEFDDGRQPVNSFLANALKERWIPWNPMFRAQPHEGVDRNPFEGLARRPGVMRWRG